MNWHLKLKRLESLINICKINICKSERRNALAQNEKKLKKEKRFPAAGIIFLFIFGINAVLSGCYDIFLSIGGPFFAVYHLVFIAFSFLRIIPGLLLLPALFLFFLIQAIRLRKNRRYLKNCFLSVLGCALFVIAGNLLSDCVAPPASRVIGKIKLNHYEHIVEKIHCSSTILPYLTGGSPGHEDVAFFQYTFSGEDETYRYGNYTPYTNRDTYILYSEDDQCDIDGIKRHPSDYLYMTPIRENWYELEIVNTPGQ